MSPEQLHNNEVHCQEPGQYGMGTAQLQTQGPIRRLYGTYGEDKAEEQVWQELEAIPPVSGLPEWSTAELWQDEASFSETNLDAWVRACTDKKGCTKDILDLFHQLLNSLKNEQACKILNVAARSQPDR